MLCLALDSVAIFYVNFFLIKFSKLGEDIFSAIFLLQKMPICDLRQINYVNHNYIDTAFLFMTN